MDTWHFATDPYLDPRIRTTDLRVRILLYSSVAFKMPTKKSFFSMLFCLLPCFLRVQSSKTKTHKVVTKQKISRFFLLLCSIMEGYRDTDPNPGPRIRCLFDPLDPGSGIGLFWILDPGSQTHICESLMTIFGLIGTNFFLYQLKLINFYFVIFVATKKVP